MNDATSNEPTLGRIIGQSLAVGGRLRREHEAPSPRRVTDLPTVGDLVEVRRCFAMLQAALSLAAEGVTRASATEVGRRAFEQGTTLQPSEIGQIASACGIASKTSHGRSRLALNVDELSHLRDAVAGHVTSLEPRFEAEIERFEDLDGRLSAMRKRVEEATAMQDELQRLQNFVDSNRNTELFLKRHHEQAEQLERQAAESKRLQAHIRDLEMAIQAIPELTKREAELAQQLSAAETLTEQLSVREATATQEEQHLGQRLGTLQRREALASLASLQETIQEAKRELDQVQHQLGEKKGLLSRMLGAGS